MEEQTPENEQLRFIPRHQMNRTSFYLLLFLFCLLFFNFTDDSLVKEGKLTKAEVIQELQNEKETLGNMTFGANITHVKEIIKIERNRIVLRYITAFTFFSYHATSRDVVHS